MMVLIGWGGDGNGYIGDPLAGIPVYPEEMTVEDISREPDGSIRATGHFGFHDCIEDSHGRRLWEAVGVAKGETCDWKVVRKDDGRFCFQSRSGERPFTLIESVNVEIKAFIADRLNFCYKTLLARV